MKNNTARNKLLPLALLLRNVLPANAQCQPCDLVPTGFTVRPGTGCVEYISCINGQEANVQSCSAGTAFDLAILGCNWVDLVNCPPDPECTPTVTSTTAAATPASSSLGPASTDIRHPSVFPTYSPTIHPRLFGKSGKGSKDSKSVKGSKATNTLKDFLGSKSGKSAKSVWNDNYKGLFGDYERATGTLQKQERVVDVSHSKSSAHPRRYIGGLWFPIVLACGLVASSAITIGL